MLTVLNIHFKLNYRTYVRHVLLKGESKMTDNEIELIKLIRENDNPEEMAAYMLSLFYDYLRTHAPSQEKPFADPLESA